MRTNKIYCLKALIIAAVVIVGCGPKDGFNKADIKGKLAEPLEADKISKVKALPDKQSKDLSTTEQDTLGDVVVNFLHEKFDVAKAAKVECHLTALGKDKSTCEKKRAKCLTEMAKVPVNDLKAMVKSNEKKIRDFVKMSTYTPKDYLNAFDMLTYGMDAMTAMECGITKQEMKKAAEDAQKTMETKYGTQETTKAQELITKLFEYTAPEGGLEEQPNP